MTLIFMTLGLTGRQHSDSTMLKLSTTFMLYKETPFTLMLSVVMLSAIMHRYADCGYAYSHHAECRQVFLLILDTFIFV